MSNNASAFSFAMTLVDPAKVDELRFRLSQPETGKAIHAALEPISTLHYARFLPLKDQGQILFVAEFDGEMDKFVTQLGERLSDQLSDLLKDMKNQPALPVADHLDAFRDYVKAVQGKENSPFSAYKEKSVPDILNMPAARGAPRENTAAPPLGASNAIQSKVAGGFSLLMTLEDPRKLPELLARLGEDFTKTRIDKALASLDYVHYARFLPLLDRGALMIITEFDGVMRDYVMDFAAALDREFAMILAYMKERPPLPVSEYPNEFWAYVDGHLVADTGLYSAYPDRTVLDIVGADKPKELPDRPPEPETPAVDLKDVQGNVLKGFRGTRAFHYYLRFPDAELGRRFLAKCKATAAFDIPESRKDTQSICRNIGFTHAGLAALGVPPPLLAAFPEAFREGPARRAARIGDSDAPDWTIGNSDKPDIHAVVSLLCREDADAQRARDELEQLMSSHEVSLEPGADKTAYGQFAEALPGNLVHFGYRDGISQPRIAGIQEMPEGGPASNRALPGDFLLGHNYVNSRGGRYIGKLVEPLAQNGTYAAFRVIEQKVAEFDAWLKETAEEHAKEHELTPDLLAAKLMGRWKDGTPLTKHNEAKADTLTPQELNDFNYLSSDDHLGLRCPIGAHIRRLNPRGGMVLGLPWGRTVLRRGLPFGPTYDEANPDDKPRGLVGMFLCGDLEGQFEFLLKVWGRNDLSSFGLRGTRDPFTSNSKDEPTPFHFVTEQAPEGITVKVPSFVKTTGSLYLFMPGLKGLDWLASAGWSTMFPAVPPRSASIASGEQFDPTTAAFRSNPYGFYATLRARQQVLKVEHQHNSYWVLSHQLVTEVCDEKNQEVFLKPGKNRMPQLRPFGINGGKPDGLFFMDPRRHTEVRLQLDDVFKRAIAPVTGTLRERAGKLIKQLSGSTMQLVREYASRMAADTFMEVMGIPVHDLNLERKMVEAWTRTMLAGHDFLAPEAVRSRAGSSSLALRSYLAALTDEHTPKGEEEIKSTCPIASTHIMSGLGKLSACPVKDMKPLDHDEATNTASHFALGGYLSTEFLITTGVYNLLRHPGQWELLNKNPELLDRAVWEMLRYDAPFQMADRHVDADYKLGDVQLHKDDRLTVVYGSANRDEIFPDADRFDITRDYSRDKIYGFGHGIHRCIGRDLAVEISKAAIGELVHLYPNAKLVDTGQWLGDPYFRSLTEVTISLG